MIGLVVIAGCSDPEPIPPVDAPAKVKTPRPRNAGGRIAAKPTDVILPRFSNVTESVGIDFRREDDMRGLHRLIESTGGGVAAFDYDGDGQLDLFFTNGCHWPATRDEGQSNQLFRQDRNDRFSAVTGDTGLVRHGYHQGCATGDVEGDGFDDLYVTALGDNALYHNNGDGTFTDVTAATDTAVSAWSTSAAFSDVNGDGVLDLYVCTYVKMDDPPRLCPRKDSPDGYVQCSPTDFAAEDDVLFLGDGSGGFRNVTRDAGIIGVDGKGLGVAIFDTNGDGRPDIFVANDGTPNFLYMNNPAPLNGTKPSAPRFTERAAELGAALSSEGAAQACMGIACGDYDADGWLDMLITNYYAEMNALYRNQHGEGFADEIIASGMGPASRLVLGFGTEFLDFDNDGWLDLFVANGHVDDLSWGPGHEPYRMKPQFFRNEHNGRFTDVSPWSGEYFLKEWLGRGVATGDIDNDGDVDLVVSHQRDPSSLLRNDTESNARSVVLRLIGRGDSNRSGFGTRVEAEGLGMTLVREVIGGGSYQSASDRRIHIGLGKRTSIPRLKIRWPSGTEEERRDLAAGSYLVIEGREPIRLTGDQASDAAIETNK